MLKLSDTNAIKVIRLLPVILVTVFLVIAIPIGFTQINYRLEKLEQNIYQTHHFRQKQQMRHQVDSAMKQIQYEHGLIRGQLQQQLKSRIDEAYAIAENIHLNNPQLSKAELASRIITALRPIRFNQSRGYYFIYQMDGVAVMHPLQPQIEGKQMIDREDLHGTRILDEHIKLIRQSDDGGAFYNWWFEKPDRQGEFEKFGYGRQFKPLDWFIGTGEYLEDINQDVREKLLKWLSHFKFDENGYVFVLSGNGTILAHLDNQLVGTSVATLTQAIRQLSRGGGQEEFIRYQFYNPEADFKLDSKIGYVRLMPEWQWWVGAGFFQSELADRIEQDLVKARKEHNHSLIQLSFLLLVTGFLAVLPCMKLSNAIERRVSQYQARILQDLNLLTEHRSQLKHQAEHDALTELPNRPRIRFEIERAIVDARNGHHQMALVFLDVDNFKRINDNYGYDVGDQLLRYFAQLLIRHIGYSGIAGRFGGDEFVICIPHFQDKSTLSQLINELCSESVQTTEINGHSINSGLTAAIAIYPDDGAMAEELLSKTDLLLSDAKIRTNDRVHFVDAALSAQYQEQLLLESEMQLALAEQQIEIFYQPQVDGATHHMTSVEALCRWNNPRLGYIPPDVFIAIAEKTGGIHALGDYVLSQACSEIHRLNRSLQQPLMLSVNISPVQLMQPDFVERIAQIVTQSQLPAELLTLEVTENVLIDDTDKVRQTLNELKALKLHISLDDFGTGFSSLRYINSLPIDEIKIDRAFINDMLQNPHSMNVTRTIIAMGQFNQMKVVAEGVETDEQQAWLTEMGCQLLQGYFFSRPVPLDKLKPMLTLKQTTHST